MEKYYLKNYLDNVGDNYAYLRSATDVPQHTHTDFFEFIIVTYGSYETNEKICSKNTLMIYQPGSSHSMKILEPHSTHFTLLFSPSFISDSVNKYFFQNKKLFTDPFMLFSLTNSQVNYITELVDSLVDMPDEERKFTYRLILYNIFHHMQSLGHRNSQHTVTDGSYVDVLIERLNNFQYMNDEISVLYTDFPVAQTKLSAEFKRKTGMTVVRYRNIKRMEYAAQMLTNWNSSVTDVANQLNISCISWFSSEFKKYHGISPKKYQTLYRKPYPKYD